MSDYRHLDAKKIHETVALLGRRIAEAFPASGLAHLAGSVEAVAAGVEASVVAMRRPHLPLRAAMALLLIGAVAVVVKVSSLLRASDEIFSLVQFLQAAGATIEAVAILSAFVFYLASLERRVKRSRAQKALAELRSLAHLIDLHQLGKNYLAPGDAGAPPGPPRLAGAALSRYLNYCNEMLSLIGLIAAYHAQEFDDFEARETVEQIEDLTTALSQKIWQKATLLERAP